MRRLSTLALLLSAPVTATLLTVMAPPAAAATPVTVADYTVFIDPPTQFVFVKLPQGWKFAGKADGALAATLPANVVTRLLPADAE
jgi:hypothetical protein